MYLPAHFEEVDADRVADMIAANPLAVLVAQGEGGLVANHIPLLRSGSGKLIGHVALANDLHEVLEDGQEALAIFRGEQAYISPNWYPSKAEHHKHVPTWNYQVVHMYGRISFFHELAKKRAIVGRLTSVFERATNGDDGWRMTDAPADYMEAMLDGIVGFEIEVSRTVAKSKLSQNREAGDHRTVAGEMAKRGFGAMADAMEAFSKRR